MGYATLAGRIAVVTGAASGMGAATAEVLADSGAKVALVARRADRLAELSKKINANGGEALAVAVDVTDPDSVTAGADLIHETFGRVDLVVNSAGVMLPHLIAEGREDEWLRMIDTNITGVLRIIRAFTDDLVRTAAEGGTADLVNISSIGAHVAFPAYAVYGATKAAITQLSTSLRTELGPKDVRVTNIEPGLTRTELGDHIASAEHSAQLDQMFEVLEPLSADEIADLIAYTTSRARHINLRQVIMLPTRQA